jgi:hypothetical protein
VSREANLALNSGNPARDSSLQIRVDRLRWKIHGKVELRPWYACMPGVGQALGNEGALSYTRFRKTEPSRLRVRPRHSGEIDTKRRRQGAVGGKLLTPSQPATRDIGCESFHDSPVNRAVAISERRDPIHTITLSILDCMGSQLY